MDQARKKEEPFGEYQSTDTVQRQIETRFLLPKCTLVLNTGPKYCFHVRHPYMAIISLRSSPPAESVLAGLEVQQASLCPALSLAGRQLG